MRATLLVVALAVLGLPILARDLSQPDTAWRDPSPHHVRWITVDSSIRLEVLDWGGSGPPLILLGCYYSAHQYDGFAPKLTNQFHVYGITRRGIGASDKPATGYAVQRSVNDLLEVLDALKAEKSLLVGVSCAGQVLTMFASQHSDRLSGLVYLDGASDPTTPPLDPPLPDSTTVPRPRPERPKRNWSFPQALDQEPLDPVIRRAITVDARVKPNYAGIRVPVLALYQAQRPFEEVAAEYDIRNEQERAALLQQYTAVRNMYKRWQQDLLAAIPTARIVELVGANLFMFLSNEADVLREIRAFAATLPTPSTPSAVMQTYCVSCHSGPVQRGGFSLDRIDVTNPAKDAEAWERVVRQLRAHAMPVMGAARPDSKTNESTISALTDAMDRAARPGKPLTELEIATRLARLVWNTEPDEPLLDAVAKGQLHDTEVLQKQVRRMLADSKSSALVTGFFSAWLSLDQLTTMKRDSGLFPEFDDDLRSAMQRETELFVASQLRDDRNPLELWTANYTFLNERLARHYGVPGISGPEYQRVTWPGSERAGLLGHGSILTLTSYLFNAYPVEVPTTSPAQRGKWILTRVLGVNPPATVPNVPSPDYPFAKHTPLVAQSRTFPATPCLACHRSFFPLSYALENFDVLGRWRTDYGPGAINASGSMVDGTMFNGPVELRRALLERSDAFLNLLTEKLLAYANSGPSAIHEVTPPGRMPIVRSVLRESKAQNYSWSSLIAAIAKATGG